MGGVKRLALQCSERGIVGIDVVSGLGRCLRAKAADHSGGRGVPLECLGEFDLSGPSLAFPKRRKPNPKGVS